jgi:hypothetical protein
MVHTRHSQERPWGQIEYTDDEGTTVPSTCGDVVDT